MREGYLITFYKIKKKKGEYNGEKVHSQEYPLLHINMRTVLVCNLKNGLAGFYLTCLLMLPRKYLS